MTRFAVSNLLRLTLLLGGGLLVASLAGFEQGPPAGRPPDAGHPADKPAREPPPAVPSAPPAAPNPPPATPMDAYALAWADLQTIPAPLRPFYRYLWVASGVPQDAQATSLAVHWISRSSLAPRPVDAIGKGRLVLLRLDLRVFFPLVNDLKEILGLWEEFQFDPRFSLLVTKDTLKLLTTEQREQMPKPRKRVTVRTKVGVRQVKRPVAGKPEEFEVVDEDVFSEVGQIVEADVKDLADVDVLRVPSPALDPKLVTELTTATGSQAPVVEDNYFRDRVLSTLKFDGVYKALYGGLYYEFSGIPLAKKGTQTDEDAFFEAIGLKDPGESLEALFNRLRSDQRAAVFRSDVTGGPRLMELYRNRGGFREHSGAVAVTHDLKLKNRVNIGQHPIANIVEFRDDAREVIYERANGMQGYGLFNGDGARQDSVPEDVAVNYLIPDGHPKILQPAIDCIWCHGTQGGDGWQPIRNDVKRLLSAHAAARAGRPGLDVFADLVNVNEATPETLERLHGWYNSDPTTWLLRARDDYSRSLLLAGGRWQEAKPDQTDVVKVGSQRIADLWTRRHYRMVSPAWALEQVGIQAEKGKEVETLNRLLPPVAAETVRVPFLPIEGIVPEDPRIGALKAGIDINWQDFDQVYTFLLLRVLKTLASERAQADKEKGADK